MIRMAVNNCLCKKSTSIQIIIGVTISFVLYICVFGYIDMLREKLEHTVKAYSSSNCVSVYEVDSEKASELTEYVTDNYKISDIKRYSVPYDDEEFIDESYNECGVVPLLCFSVLEADGKEYSFSEGIGNLYELNSYIAVAFYDEKYSMIADSDLAEYEYASGRDNPVITGDYSCGENELILPECYAEAYNIPPEELVGKNITIRLTGEKGEMMIIDNCRVKGILDNDYFSLSSSDIPSIMINKTINPDDMVTVKFYPENFSDITKITEDLNSKYHIDASAADAFEIYEYLSKQILFADKVMTVTAYMVIMAMLLNVLRIIIYSFRKRMKYLGMLRAVGMRDCFIVQINLIELVIETVISAVLAAAFSSFFMKYIISHVAEITGASLNYSFFFASAAIRLAALSFVFWTTAIASIFFILKRNTAIELTKR